MSLPLIVVAMLLLCNLATYAMFYFDKRRAKSGGWRVPERSLLGLALVGGSPAAKLAQHQLRHKTRKQPFARLLNGIVLLHISALAAAIWIWIFGI